MTKAKAAGKTPRARRKNVLETRLGRVERGLIRLQEAQAMQMREIRAQDRRFGRMVAPMVECLAEVRAHRGDFQGQLDKARSERRIIATAVDRLLMQFGVPETDAAVESLRELEGDRI